MIQLFHLILRPQIQVLNRHRCLKGALLLMRPGSLDSLERAKCVILFYILRSGKIQFLRQMKN